MWALLMLLILGVGLSGVAGGIQPLLLNEVLDRVEKTQATIQDLEGRYVERLQHGNLPEQVFRGEISVKRPQRIRLDQERPEKQTLISDGTTLWLYMPAQQQLLTGDWNAWLRATRFPIEALDFVGHFSPERWRRHFHVLFEGYDPPFYKLLFQPLKPGDPDLTVWISENSFLPARIQMRQEDLRAEVSFQRLKPNVALRDRFFQPHVPSGTANVPLNFRE